jgi:predicted alpha/beta-hydrolase family hydrolase
MSSTDEIEVVLLQETGHDLLPKCEGHASIAVSPQFRILAMKKKNFISQLSK